MKNKNNPEVTLNQNPNPELTEYQKKKLRKRQIIGIVVVGVLLIAAILVTVLVFTIGKK